MFQANDSHETFFLTYAAQNQQNLFTRNKNTTPPNNK